MHSGMAPGTAISAAHSRGTAPKPISRMAVAGKMLVHVGGGGEEDADDVVLDAGSLRSMSSRISSCERSVTCSTVSASTVVAPRRPRTMRAAAMAGHSTGNGPALPATWR